MTQCHRAQEASKRKRNKQWSLQGASGEEFEEGQPEMTARGSASDVDVHQLLEQLVHMCELFSGKEVELAQVRSELTFACKEAEAAKREA